MDGSALHTAWPSSIPDLATERLRLRAPLRRDASALLALIGDPEVTKYINVATMTTLAEAPAVLERLDQRYAARDMIRWAIELVEHNEMIGTVGLLRFDFEHRHAELGYASGGSACSKRTSTLEPARPPQRAPGQTETLPAGRQL